MFVFIYAIAFLFGGCGGGGELLVVSFDSAETHRETLRYKLVSDRTVQLELESSKQGANRNKPQTISEKLEMVIAYKGVDINSYGQSRVEGVCESAKVARISLSDKKTEKKDNKHSTHDSICAQLPNGVSDLYGAVI